MLPELHLQPQSMKGTKYKGQDLGSLKGTGLVKKYRQNQGETATVRLAQYLGTLGASPVSCQFVTELVDEEGPGDAIDKYGRFVGNVRINNVDGGVLYVSAFYHCFVFSILMAALIFARCR